MTDTRDGSQGAEQGRPYQLSVKLSDEECRAFGLPNVRAAEDLIRWAMDRTGVVLGAEGRGGSGVFVRRSDGRIGLLTARHVVVACALTDSLTVSYPGNPGRSFSPDAAFAAPEREIDFALLLLPEAFSPPSALTPDEWTSHSGEPLVEGTAVVPCGAPGAWKDGIDQEKAVIGRTVFAHYFSRVGRLMPEEKRVWVDVDWTDSQVPESWAGMSGGPVFSLGRRLLGINAQEIANKENRTNGAILVLPRDQFPPEKPPESMSNLAGYKVSATMGCDFEIAIGRETRFVRLTFVLARSESSPDELGGRFGVVTSVSFSQKKGVWPIPINTRRKFSFYEDSDEEVTNRLKEELQFIVMEWLPKRAGSTSDGSEDKR